MKYLVTHCDKLPATEEIIDIRVAVANGMVGIMFIFDNEKDAKKFAELKNAKVKQIG